MVKGHFKGHWIKRYCLCPMCIDRECKECCFYLEDHCINYDLIIPAECFIGICAYKREDN